MCVCVLRERVTCICVLGGSPDALDTDPRATTMGPPWDLCTANLQFDTYVRECVWWV